MKDMKRLKNIYLEINLHVLHVLDGFNPKSILGMSPKKFNPGSMGGPARIFIIFADIRAERPWSRIFHNGNRCGGNERRGL